MGLPYFVRAHLYVGGAHIQARSPRGLMQPEPKDVVLVESYKDASLLDLDQVSLGWSPADGSLETASEKGKQSIWRATERRRNGRQPEPAFF